MDILVFNNELSSLVQHIPKHNFLIISGDTNVHISKDRNSKLSLYNLPNRNGEYLTEFSFKNRLVYLNIKFQKKGEKTI